MTGKNLSNPLYLAREHRGLSEHGLSKEKCHLRVWDLIHQLWDLSHLAPLGVV